jgi:hypothetical protein
MLAGAASDIAELSHWSEGLFFVIHRIAAAFGQKSCVVLVAEGNLCAGNCVYPAAE